MANVGNVTDTTVATMNPLVPLQVPELIVPNGTGMSMPSTHSIELSNLCAPLAHSVTMPMVEPIIVPPTMTPQHILTTGYSVDQVPPNQSLLLHHPPSLPSQPGSAGENVVCGFVPTSSKVNVTDIIQESTSEADICKCLPCDCKEEPMKCLTSCAFEMSRSNEGNATDTSTHQQLERQISLTNLEPRYVITNVSSHQNTDLDVPDVTTSTDTNRNGEGDFLTSALPNVEFGSVTILEDDLANDTSSNNVAILAEISKTVEEEIQIQGRLNNCVSDLSDRWNVS